VHRQTKNVFSSRLNRSELMCLMCIGLARCSVDAIFTLCCML